MKLVLDTHAVVWWTCLPELLSSAATQALESAEVIGIPAITFWETSLLVRKGKLELSMTMSEWTEAVQSIPRCQPLPLTPEIAVLADSLQMHPDPADRFIVATTIEFEAALLTKDGLIRQAQQVPTIW